MTDPTPQPGWYPVATGSGQLRWWDGTKWTEHVHDPAQAAAAYAPAAKLVAPEGTIPNTVYVWLVVAMPVLVIIGLLQFDFAGYLRTFVTLGSSNAVDPDQAMSAIFSPSYFVLLGLGLLTFALTVVFSYLDYRELRRRGVPRPFHWAWSFLETGAVYMIGRSVVVYRRTGRGLAPLWVWIGVLAVTFIVATVEIISALNAVLPLLQQYSGSY